ncbi:MAG TPA: hypothetical protein VEC96_16530 [Anaerolineae bacterium]|jgi:hypothetical protein|nr:hypothetical protein [Anaerolineae bacterium]
MPRQWVEPELLLEHEGVSIYYTYRDNAMVSTYNFTVNEAYDHSEGDWGDADATYIFDWTDIPLAPGIQPGGWQKEDAIRYAIEQGWLTEEGVNLPGEV